VCSSDLLGRTVDLRSLEAPLLLLAGAADAIAPPAQVFAGAALAGAGARTRLSPAGHLQLFMGRRTLADVWPPVARWLAGDDFAEPPQSSR
jgi:poly(3-hydroxyalkanoate) synthetase